MARKTLAKLLLLIMLYEVLMISVTKAKPWWGRRRRSCSSSRPNGVWHNKWHESFSEYCPNGYSMRYWHSVHKNCKEDRIHYLQCGYGPVPYHRGNCDWSGHYVNDYDQPVNFKCPHNGFITGVKSVYSWHYRDRRFNFRCCHVNGFMTHSCKMTPYQNNWDQDVSYLVPNGYYLVGVYSYHHNYFEDRRIKFEICRFGKFKGGK